jgi:hypothetical protein
MKQKDKLQIMKQEIIMEKLKVIIGLGKIEGPLEYQQV